jgi:hypothetical protein
LIIAGVLAYGAVHQFVATQKERMSATGLTTSLKGEGPSIAGVDWSSSRENAVLALSTKCHFCTASAPFTFVSRTRRKHMVQEQWLCDLSLPMNLAST